ncbi:PD-(D/E)XK nuclease family protein [Alloprevotella tannerae]|uniref:PD-(D/E)XK nuclease family protein n=1 Tax=Alloprevotella tannerae TaxID=76122 RepID=UPI001EDAC07A|nr:PD-(D/E)XK nuclease family protein [Alloprevotella tannerae]MCG2647786.1 PD-(D/E)XK nuclease family protein [Alloprevotella tannerae]
MDIEERNNNYTDLLCRFEQLPKQDIRPTFMDICRYPYNRFEEVCSRILQFYLNPFAEHGLHDLWLLALWRVSGQGDTLPFYNKVECVTEEYAEGKRIDIVVKSEEFVIAIENKTTAGLYNQLDVYANHIRKNYSDRKQRILIVLSVFPLLDSKSKKRMAQNAFRPILYKDLFSEVNKELGNYIMSCDQKYLTYMFDFMKTINNINNVNSERELNFFMQNKERVEDLISRYNKFREGIRPQQVTQIASIEEKVEERTKVDWWIWEGWDLGISFNDKTNRIGIESSYEPTEREYCGEFHIYITTWRKEHWPPYKEAVLKAFPDNIRLDENCGNRVYLHLPIIDGNNEEEIVNALVDAYNKMKKITDEIH